jgi:hypothetical protein
LKCFEGRELERRNISTLIIVLVAVSLASLSQHLLFTPQVPNASALQTPGNLGVYADKNCLTKISSINWGTLTRGETKKVIVYVRNESNQTIYLLLTPQDWSPLIISSYLTFSSTMLSTKMAKSGIAQVTLILYVSLYAAATSFTFNIVLSGSDHLLGDVNKDGIVDLKDVTKVAKAYGSTPSSPGWDPNCDINMDLVVDLKDYFIVCKNYGQST